MQAIQHQFLVINTHKHISYNGKLQMTFSNLKAFEKCWIFMFCSSDSCAILERTVMH